MSTYIFGVLLAFIGPILHAWANILDNYFSNSIFKRLEPVILLSGIIGMCLLPIIYFIDPPHLISLQFAGMLFVIALIEVLYTYPYYYSLRHADTSVVAALFSLGKLFVPLFAFLFISERLALSQYVGFCILTLAVVALSINFKKMTLSRAFLAMLLVSIILAIQSVLLKHVYELGMGWGTSIFWMTLFQFIIAFGLFLNPKSLKEFSVSMKKIKSVAKLMILMELLSQGGTLTGYYALYLIPVSVEKGISSTQPIFVLLYAVLFTKFAPKMFKEYLGKDGVLKKIILFILTIIGILLIS